MAILETVDVNESDGIEYLCSNCARPNRVDASNLCLGYAENELVQAPDFVYLPACECGAVNFLQRTWETENGGSKQRGIVNGLCEWLKRNGKVHPKLAAHYKAESGRPPIIRDVSFRHDDIHGNKRKAAQEEHAKKVREEVAAAEALRVAREEKEREEQATRSIMIRREALAVATAAKRLGLRPGERPPEEEIEKERAKSAKDLLAEFRALAGE